MSISNNYQPLKELGNGVTTEFSDNWQILSSSYIQVFLENVTTGVQTLIDQGGASDEYTVSFDSSGFIVTFNTAPTSTYYVVIARNVDVDQTTPYKTSKGFQGETLEDSFDKLTAITQDLQDQVNRSPKTPVGNDPLVFPSYSSGKVLGWSDATSGEVVSSVNTLLDMEGAITAVAALAAGSGVKVSSNDTTVGFLNGKLVAGSGIGFTENNDGGNETLTLDVVDASETVKGIVEAATSAEMTAGTASKFPDAAKVKTYVDTAIDAVESGQDTLQATTSGTTKDFTIPSGTRKITICFNGISTSGTSNVMAQLGDAGGPETTGYSGSCGNGSSAVLMSSGFLVTGGSGITAVSIFNGSMTITLMDAATFLWACQGVIGFSNGAAVYMSGGVKATSALTTTLRLTMVNGTDTFDAGSVNVIYEK